MSDRQFSLPTENLSTANAFTEATLGTDEFELSPFASAGYKTRVYACETELGSYILRHGYDVTGFAKDSYVAEHFGDKIPIPEVLGVEHLDDKSGLCLSVRVAGDIADDSQLGEIGTPLNDSFSETLRALHETDVTASHGWGFAKSNGKGVLPKMLFDLGLQHKVASRYWDFLAARNTTIDRATFKDIVAMQRSLGAFCMGVQERKLCHGDLKNDNLLADEGSITGVIDWSRFGYGDPAYDLGILHVRYPGAVDSQAHAQATGISERNLDERILYYAIGECTVSIGFFGEQDMKAKVAEYETRLLVIANEAEVIRP